MPNFLLSCLVDGEPGASCIAPLAENCSTGSSEDVKTPPAHHFSWHLWVDKTLDLQQMRQVPKILHDVLGN